MSARHHPALQRYNHKLGGLNTRHLDDRVDRDAVAAETQAGIARARARLAEATQRRFHPAVPAPEHKCYRVIRRFTRNGTMDFEDIGATKTLGEALAISIREQGYATILDPNGKPASYNGQPMTEVGKR
jgi:hypothetical protein